MTTPEHTFDQGSREQRAHWSVEELTSGGRTLQRTTRLRIAWLASAAAALFAGSTAAQLPAKPLGKLKIAPADSFTVTAKAGEGGKIVPSGTLNVRAGATQQFAITPNSGWKVLSITGCGGKDDVVHIPGGQPTYTTGRVVGPCNVLASFVRLAPRPTSFKINNGAAQTLTRSVTVSYTVATEPTHPAPTSYMLSMRADFLGAEWKPITGTSAGIGYELQPGPGTKTLYFRLRSGPWMSEVLSDSIDLAQRQTYTVTGREFYDAAQQAGFGTRWTYQAQGVDCLLIPGPADGVEADVVVARASAPTGGDGTLKCRFDFFAGAVLRNDFLFSDIRESTGTAGCETFRKGGPTPGGTSVNYKVELNRHVGAECQYRLVAVILEGPANRNRREAFGPQTKP